jgi:hypothetical protein
LLKDPIEFSKKLLELKSEMDEMVEKSFLNDMKFQKCRDSVRFSWGLNLLVVLKLYE